MFRGIAAWTDDDVERQSHRVVRAFHRRSASLPCKTARLHLIPIAPKQCFFAFSAFQELFCSAFHRILVRQREQVMPYFLLFANFGQKSIKILFPEYFEELVGCLSF